jgi:hypothetical protein
VVLAQAMTLPKYSTIKTELFHSNTTELPEVSAMLVLQTRQQALSAKNFTKLHVLYPTQQDTLAIRQVSGLTR